MGKKLILLSCLFMFADYAFAQHQSKGKIKLKSNWIVEVLKTTKEFVCGTNADFNRKAKVLFYKACNPSLFFYKKTEYVDLVKAINEHNVDKLDVLIADYNLTPQAKQILLNHADRAIASLEKEIIDESTLAPAVVAQPAVPTVGAPVPVSLNAPAQQQPIVVDNSPKVNKFAFAFISAIALLVYSKEDKEINCNFREELMRTEEYDYINRRFIYKPIVEKWLPNMVEVQMTDPISNELLCDVDDKPIMIKVEEKNNAGSYIKMVPQKNSDGTIKYKKRTVCINRKAKADIKYLEPLKKTLMNPIFLIPLFYFANLELLKRLEYKNSNKKVAVLPKALAIRDLILNAPTKSVME